jgi:hypothetical protein
VSDLGGMPLAEHAGDLDIADGPDAVLDQVDARFAELLADVGGFRRTCAASASAFPVPSSTTAGAP